MTDVMLNAVLSMDAYNRGYGAGTEHGWEQLVQMQVKGASNISADEDQLVHQGIMAV